MLCKLGTLGVTVNIVLYLEGYGKLQPLWLEELLNSLLPKPHSFFC